MRYDRRVSAFRTVLATSALVALTGCGRIGYERVAVDATSALDAGRIDDVPLIEDAQTDAQTEDQTDAAGDGGINGGRDGAARVCDGGECIDGVEFFELASRRYALLRSSRTHARSAAACALLGMRLARIESRAEHDGLWANCDSMVTWIGGSDVSVEGEWRWIDDGALFWRGDARATPVAGVFHSWGPDEPNNLVSDGNDEDCLSFWPLHDGGWNDEPCERAYPAMCEQR